MKLKAIAGAQDDERYIYTGDIGSGGDDQSEVTFSGQYELTIKEIPSPFEYESVSQFCNVKWKWKKKNKLVGLNARKYRLCEDLYKALFKLCREKNMLSDVKIIGYTEMRRPGKYFETAEDGEDVIVRASPWYGDRPWYDFALVRYLVGDDEDDESSWAYYPAKIMGFIDLSEGDVLAIVDGEIYYAIVRAATRPLPWSTVTKDFVSDFYLSTNDATSLNIVPVGSIVRTMLVFGDHGGDTNKHFVSLPKQQWATYFSNKINKR